MVPANQEDGAPRRRKCKAEGGDEAYGEKCPEGPARVGSCRVSGIGSGIPKGGSVRAVGDHVRVVVGQVQAACAVFERLASVFEQLERKSEQLQNVSEQRKGMAYR